MPVYGGTNHVYAVTAGATVPAAFAGVVLHQIQTSYFDLALHLYIVTTI